MYNTLRNPQLPGVTWPTDYITIPDIFGVKGSKLPANGLAPRMFNGIKVWVEPKTPWPRMLKNTPRTHRALAECPLCFKIVPIGRLHQHSIVHRQG